MTTSKTPTTYDTLTEVAKDQLFLDEIRRITLPHPDDADITTHYDEEDHPCSLASH